MKKILISAGLMMLPAMVQAEYIKAHDPHVVAPLDLTCQSNPTPPPPGPTPGEVYNPNGYYNDAIGKTGAQLKTALNGIISAGVVKLPYTSSNFDVWDALDQTDEDPDNSSNVIYLYTGRSEPKANKAQSNQRHYWNREHVYPKSNGGFNKRDDRNLDNMASGYTDIHHLRPTDAWVNTKRSDNEYDNGGTPLVDDKSPIAGTDLNKLDTAADSFEPRDAVKGDVARMIFYMVTRYEGNDPHTPDLELSNTTKDNGTAFGNACTLFQWHKQDAVDAFERLRNNRIQNIQKNRNPFIDNPDWVDSVFATEIADCAK